MMEVDPAKTTNLLTFCVMTRIHQLEKGLSFRMSKIRRVEKLSHPIHFMSIGEIECDLHIFVRIFNDDEAVVINSKKIVQRFCTSVVRKWAALK